MILLPRLYKLCDMTKENFKKIENKHRQVSYIDTLNSSPKSFKVSKELFSTLRPSRNSIPNEEYNKYILLNNKIYFRNGRDLLETAFHYICEKIKLYNVVGQIALQTNNNTYHIKTKYNNNRDLYLIFTTFEQLYIYIYTTKSDFIIRKLKKKENLKINNSCREFILNTLEYYFNLNYILLLKIKYINQDKTDFFYNILIKDKHEQK